MIQCIHDALSFVNKNSGLVFAIAGFLNVLIMSYNQKEHKRNKDPGDKPPGPPRQGRYEGFYL